MYRLAAALSLAIFALAAPALAAPTMAAHTTAVVFNAKSMHVTAHRRGYCWVSSIASRRKDAYRCMVGNEIHDPCFTLSPKTVACPVNPAENRGIEIALTKPLPAPVTEQPNAWQMQLVSGALCNIATGTQVPGYSFYCTGKLVCSAPPPGEPRGAVFVRCATAENGKIGAASSFLVRTLYM